MRPAGEPLPDWTKNKDKWVLDELWAELEAAGSKKKGKKGKAGGGGGKKKKK